MLHGKRVAVIEDDNDVRVATALLLEAMNASVFVFSSAVDFIEHGGSVRADIILLDMILPGISGLEALNALRCEFPSTPVLIVSGSGDPACQMYRDGIGFLEKPYPAAKLADEILSLSLRGTGSSVCKTAMVRSEQFQRASYPSKRSETHGQVDISMIPAQHKLPKDATFE
jgi:FixJ family two-component response regulator